MFAKRRRTVLALSLSLLFAGAAHADTGWVARSDQHAQSLLHVISDFAPEFATQVGITGYDEGVVDLKPEVNERFRKALSDAKRKLDADLAAEKDPQVRQDLEIMRESTQLQIDSSLINEKYLLPF